MATVLGTMSTVNNVVGIVMNATLCVCSVLFHFPVNYNLDWD